MNPISFLIRCFSLETSEPATKASPPPGFMNVERMESNVDLPAPLGPKTVRNPPCSRVRSIPLSTGKNPNCFSSPLVSIANTPGCISFSKDFFITADLRSPLRKLSHSRLVTANRFIPQIPSCFLYAVGSAFRKSGDAEAGKHRRSL